MGWKGTGLRGRPGFLFQALCAQKGLAFQPATACRRGCPKPSCSPQSAILLLLLSSLTLPCIFPGTNWVTAPVRNRLSVHRCVGRCFHRGSEVTPAKAPILARRDHHHLFAHRLGSVLTGHHAQYGSGQLEGW